MNTHLVGSELFHADIWTTDLTRFEILQTSLKTPKD
jgi:hypothetical protein